MNEFKKALAKEGVNVVLRQNAQGNIYGITYIDFRTKCVFNGSNLGKEFSAKGILEQLEPEQNQVGVNLNQKQVNEIRQGNSGLSQKENKPDQEQGNQYQLRAEKLNVLELLLNHEQTDDHVPNELLKKKKQKKQSRGLRM